MNLATRGRRGRVLPAALVWLAVPLSLGVPLVCAAVLGWRLQVIETGSMAPAYPAGSLAVVEPAAPADLRPGMTVVFEDPLAPGRLIAHRLMKRLPSSSVVWQTKGDANAEADPAPVAAAAVQGRIRWALPALGRVVARLAGPGAVALLVGAPIVLLLVTELAALRGRRRPA